MQARQAAALGLMALTAACASTQAAEPVHRRAAAVAPPPRYNPVGLEGVIGRTAKFLEGGFGKPDLDIREGTARKLQYAGPACVLDLYLYPPRGGGDPIVTYVDARRPDGTDFDRASCVAALERAR
ncbi:MAG: hypothetical protein JOZ90_04775 [Alphaproteobacteria bacterium]|nr:hypothetical protein [Alphaproteobacteria bacterium]MBV9373395.1 hypothetical protein [Alphaproteobacteria bacterium]MBV9900394.1 hypothetical protein [Alphaproteobacteria bacterium]